MVIKPKNALFIIEIEITPRRRKLAFKLKMHPLPQKTLRASQKMKAKN
jgi:hypothetical protein